MEAFSTNNQWKVLSKIGGLQNGKLKSKQNPRKIVLKKYFYE